MPLASLGARDIPHSTALGAPVDANVDLQVPGAVAVTAVQEVAELDAVGVVLAQREQEQLSPLAPEMLRGIDHHERPWKREGQVRGLYVLVLNSVQILLILLFKYYYQTLKDSLLR